MKKENNVINIGELYSKYPKSLNMFYDWLDDKYNIIDYRNRFKDYLYNDINIIHYMFEFLDTKGYYIYIKPIMSSETFDNNDNNNNNVLFKFCVNNVPYDNYGVRFDCNIMAIDKSLSLFEKSL